MTMWRHLVWLGSLTLVYVVTATRKGHGGYGYNSIRCYDCKNARTHEECNQNVRSCHSREPVCMYILV